MLTSYQENLMTLNRLIFNIFLNILYQLKDKEEKKTI